MLKVQKTARSVSPLTLAVVKQWLKVDGNSDDSLITTLIEQSRDLIEAYLGRSLIEYDITLTATARREVELPYGPVDSITSVKDNDGNDVDYKYYGFTVTLDSPVDTVINYRTTGDLPKGLELGWLEAIAYLYEFRGDDKQAFKMALYQNQNLQPYRMRVWV